MTTLQEAAMRKALEVLENGNRSPITTAANILRTALAQQVEPTGWKLVPVEPTDAMEIAGALAYDQSKCHDSIGQLIDAWSAMLATAPAPQPAQRIGTNSGHGHVWPRPDGNKARCGGPTGGCKKCLEDVALLQSTQPVLQGEVSP